MVDIPGDSSTTQTITVGGACSGSIEVGGDHDWIAVTLSAGQSISIALDGSGASALADPYLRLRDSSGNLLVENDDGGPGTNALLGFKATYTGVYYIDVSAWEDTTPGATQLTGDYQLRVSPYTPPPLGTVQEIAAQLTNDYWGGSSHHFAATQGGSISVNVGALTPDGQFLAREALRVWSDVIGVSFPEVSSGGQIVFSNDQDGASTGANWSRGIETSAHVNVSTQWLTNYGTTINTYSFQTFIHEIGHALGLGHAGDYNGEATFPFDARFLNDSWSMSVMSYFSPTQNTYFRDLGFTKSYVGTPMQADILAMSKLYGLSTTTRLGDTVYGFNSSAGNAIYDANVYPTIAYTIFDSGGIDTLDFSGFGNSQLIDLRSGNFSNVGGKYGNVSIALGTLIENAIGGSASDEIDGNEAANVLIGNGGADLIYGFGGNDRLDGGSGGDTLYGGAGDDFLSGGEGGDSLNGGPGNDTLSGDGGDDVLAGDGGIDRLFGGDGNDTMRLMLSAQSGDYVVDGGVGNDTAFITVADDSSRVINTGQFIKATEVLFVAMGAGNDDLTIAGVFNRISVDGGGGNDTIRIGDSPGTVTTGAGNDTIYAGSGVSTIYSGSGVDRIVFQSASASPTGAVDQLVDFQSGVDKIDLSSLAAFNLSLQSGVQGTTLNASTSEGLVSIFVGGSLVLTDVLTNGISGSPGSDLLTGTALQDVIRGFGGNDVLRGLAGADWLTGGDGADTFSGTVAELAGDRITDLSTGDRIGVSDLSFANFSYVRQGTTLSFGGVSIDIANSATRLATVAAASGTDLVAVNRYSGLSDFNGDGHSDILFQNSTGAISSWSIAGNGLATISLKNSFYADVGSGWNVLSTLDYNGDGSFDILWRNTISGDVSVWAGNRSGFTAGSFTTGLPLGSGWNYAGVGDMNGDGRDDVIFRNYDGSVSAWFGTGAGFAQNAYFLSAVGPDWKIEGFGDFDGDGLDDLLWRSSTGSISEWRSVGGSFTENSYFDSSMAPQWHVAGLADFNGDGRDDIVWRNDSGAVSVWQSTGSSGFVKDVYLAQVATNWQIAQVGDFNDDGKADLLWRNSTGALSIWQSTGSGFTQNTLFDIGPSTSWVIQAHDLFF